jgi:hypothetical protein
LELAQHVENLTAESLARLFEFIEQGAVHIAFAGLIGHKVPQVAPYAAN